MDGQGKLVDVLNEQRTAIGKLEQPFAGLNGTRERAFAVAEQFAFGLFLGQPVRTRRLEARRIKTHQRQFVAHACRMDECRHPGFSRTRFAPEQDRTAPVPGIAGLLQRLAHALGHGKYAAVQIPGHMRPVPPALGKALLPGHVVLQIRGLPRDVQQLSLRTLPGFENCEIMRYGYAIEYDCIDPTALALTLGAKDIPGLFFAGQLNGSSGYEEAAAQGLLAGINAALYVSEEPPLILRRSDAYIGVLADDLSTKGTNEPYRMMTSRAEYRLLLRQDNADLRLTELGRRTGLISDERYARLMRKKEEIAAAKRALEATVPPTETLNLLLASRNESPVITGVRLGTLLKRKNICYTDLLELCPDLPPLSDEAREQIEIDAHYGGYIEKQNEHIRRFENQENMLLPPDFDYESINGLRLEARQKLTAMRPANLGQASRISGVSPADIAVLMIKLKQNGQNTAYSENETVTEDKKI